MITVRALETTRFESVGTSKVDVDDESESDVKTQMTQSQIDSIQIKGATLTFKNINYTVKASTSNEKLHLLKDISGYFSAGKLTALMGR
jgi:ribosomal protein L19E